MTLMTRADMEAIAPYGFTRVVLPREISLSEAAALARSGPLETELFCHGAHCVSVSGQCLMSYVMGGRSGNRGECAQPCRMAYNCVRLGVDSPENREKLAALLAQNGKTAARIGEKAHAKSHRSETRETYPLSLRDMCLAAWIPEILDSGIASLKIEGRQKPASYVYGVTKIYRTLLDERRRATDDEIAELDRLFSREGFTDAYFANTPDKPFPYVSMCGVRPPMTEPDKLLPAKYDASHRRLPVTGQCTAVTGEKMTLSLTCGDKTVTVAGDVVQAATGNPATADGVRKNLAKTGGTAFFAEDIECDIDDGVNVPVSVINSLRRDVLSAAEEKLSAPNIKKCNEINFEYRRHRAFAPYLVCRFKTEEQIPDDLGSVKEIILPADSIKTRFDSSAQLPRGIFGGYEKISKKLADLKSRGVKKVWAGGLDGIAAAKANGLDFAAGFGTNIFNTLSAEEYKNLGAKKILLSPELTLSQIKDIGGDIPRGIFAYGRLPLMLTRNCPQKNVKSCAECKKSGKLVDRKDVAFPIECDGTCSEILNSRPIYMADRLGEIKNADFLLLYFTDESKEEAQKIINAYKIGKKPDGEFTRGLLYRGVE